MKRTGIYAGSFDPPTNGHLWMIRAGAALFDELVVVVAENPDKKGFLSAEERCGALRTMTADLPTVRVAAASGGFLVDTAKALGATHLLRGMRNTVDFEYEKTMARMNARMEPSLQTVFLLPPPELGEISSSLVRGFTAAEGWQRWVKPCVPACVYQLMEKKV